MRNLEISYDGDMIKNVTFRRGQSVRPLWAVLESLTPSEAILWVDRFDSLCPIACEWALAQALEYSAEVILPQRLQFVRSIFAEMNRLIYLTTYLGEIVKILGIQTSFQQIYVLREQVFQKQEQLTGGRVLPQVFNLGGVRRDLALGDVQKVRQFVQGWKFGWEKWKELLDGDPLVESRLSGLLRLRPEEIKKKGFWGIVGKASGLNYDARIHQPHGAYAQVDCRIKTEFPLNGDALTRMHVAMAEVELSLWLTEQLLQNISSEKEAEKKDLHLRPGLYSGSSESAKGPVTAVAEIDESERIRSVRLLTVGQRVWPDIEKYFGGLKGEDFDLAWASLGMSGEESEI